MLRGSSAWRAYARPNRSRNGRGPTPVQSTAGRFAGKNCRNRGFSGLLSSETEGDRLFLPGKAATLALSGGPGGFLGVRQTRMGHTYPLPGSMAPQGALCPKIARFLGGWPCIPEGSDPVFGLGQGLPWLSAGSRGVVGGSVDGNGCHQTRKRETGAQGCSPPPSTPVTRANARAACMGALLGRRAYWGSSWAWGVKLPSGG